MNLHRMLEERARAGKPVRIGLIGAGQFGTFLAQAKLTLGLYVMAVADLDPARTHAALACAGWAEDERRVRSFAQAMKSDGTHVCDDAFALVGADGLNVIDATSRPAAGITHTWDDVTADEDDSAAEAVRTRRAMEAAFASVESAAHAATPA